MSLLWFLHSSSCNSAFKSTVLTWLRNESEAVPAGSRVAPGSRSGPKPSIQCEILSRNHINGERGSFRNETGSRPGQRTRSLVFLWFSAVLLRALYLVRLRSSTSLFGNTFMKTRYEMLFSFQIKLDPVSCKHHLNLMSFPKPSKPRFLFSSILIYITTGSRHGLQQRLKEEIIWHAPVETALQWKFECYASCSPCRT